MIAIIPFITALVVATAIQAQPYKAKLDTFFDRLQQKNKAMGSLQINKNGNAVYTRIIGYSEVNGADSKPLTAATRYRIGSITKTFTATIIFQLIEEGKLKPTDRLDRFFPQLPNASKITITHLLAHRSGLPDLTDGSGKSNPRTEAEILDVISKRTPLFEPGTKYAYSNAGYVVLGYIIQKITGKSYQEALQQRIVSKLGLKDTYRGTGLVDTSKNESYSYRYFGEWKKESETHLSNPGGAGGIISTPADLAKFIEALFNGKLISKNSLALMTKDTLGLEPFTYNGKTFYGHAGGIDNFGSWLVYQPEEKLTLAYATNAKVYPVTDIIDGVFAIYYDKPFAIPGFEQLAVNETLLDTYAGVYSSTDGPAKFTVTRQGNTLFFQPPGETSGVPLQALSETHFMIESLPVEFRFDAAKKEMTIIRNGRERVLTKEN